MNDTIINYPSKAIALAFKYDEVMKSVKKGVTVLFDNQEHKCCSCGRIHSNGYLMSNKKELFSDRTNNFYTYAEPQSNFICEYCYYNYNHTDAKDNPLKQAITDCKVWFNKETQNFEVDFLSNSVNEKENNGVHNLFNSKGVLPYILLVRKAKGTRFHDNAHTAVATIDHNMVILNFGNEILPCSKKLVFEALSDFERISNTHKKLKVSDGLLFNNTSSPSMNEYFSDRIRSDKQYHADYSNFISKYGRGVRIAAKIMLQNYLSNKKNKLNLGV